jgi:hypothetical protein
LSDESGLPDLNRVRDLLAEHGLPWTQMELTDALADAVWQEYAADHQDRPLVAPEGFAVAVMAVLTGTP